MYIISFYFLLLLKITRISAIYQQVMY